jgi:methionyl-tRNA formyltransferase
MTAAWRIWVECGVAVIVAFQTGMSMPLKVIFMGSDPIALPLLDWLAGDGRALASVAAVYTQPDRPAGRGQKTGAGPVKQWAAAHGVMIRQPEKLTPDEHGWLAVQDADLALVLAYGHILKDDFIATPRLGTLNLHASILPKYRGASPIQTAVAQGESETGISLMRVVRKLDAGPVADLECVPVVPLDTATEVECKLAAACVRLLARALPRLRDGTLAFASQDEARATCCRRLVKEDGRLDLAAPAKTLAARINGLFPWPGCAVEIGGVPVKLGLADVAAGNDSGVFSPERSSCRVAGEVVGADNNGLLVATGEGILRLRRLQRPGGRMLSAADFLRGFAVPSGTRLPSEPMTRLVLEQPVPPGSKQHLIG